MRLRVVSCRSFWLFVLPLLVGGGRHLSAAAAAARLSRAVGRRCSASLALVLAGWLVVGFGALTPESFLFYVFSASAVGFGALLVTQRNPARAALSFALVVLSTCGLFLLLAAPFLMAATIIIYAGAIIVTFLFVLMLAQQEGPVRRRRPLAASRCWPPSSASSCWARCSTSSCWTRRLRTSEATPPRWTRCCNRRGEAEAKDDPTTIQRDRRQRSTRRPEGDQRDEICPGLQGRAEDLPAATTCSDTSRPTIRAKRPAARTPTLAR